MLGRAGQGSAMEAGDATPHLRRARRLPGTRLVETRDLGSLLYLAAALILLAKSTEHNPCGKICSPSGVILDKNRALVLLFSIIIYHIIRTFHLVVISPTVSERF
jgi:hypothetical protein